MANNNEHVVLFNKRTGLPISIDPHINDLAVDNTGYAHGRIKNAWYDEKLGLWGVELQYMPEIGR